MSNDAYFTGKSGTKYFYAEIADRIRKEAPHTLGKHISVQLAAIGLTDEMMNGTTPCGLPFTFADDPRTMTKYNVHIYREMRLVFRGIEADSHEAAAAFALHKPIEHANDTADCDGETFYACVDVAGDEQYEQSRWIDFEPERHRLAAPKLLASLKALLPYAESEAYCLDKLKDSPEAEAETERAWKAIESAQTAIAEADAAGILPTAATRSARFRFTHEPEEDSDRAYVLVDGRIDVKIVRTAEGIVIDVYSKDGIDVIGTMAVWDEDLAEPEQDAAEEA